MQKLEVSRDDLEEVTSIEVGNIFDFGGMKSQQLGLSYKNEAGEDVPVHLGSYGIGITRLMGTIVEVFSDEKGMVWPEAVAPFLVHLVPVVTDPEVMKYADALYEELVAAGVSVLYDDRDARAGEKLADADLIGIPARVVVGKRTLETGKVESTYRATGQTMEVTREQLLEFTVGAQKQHQGLVSHHG
jgi:prolyl-tRNA synthetase